MTLGSLSADLQEVGQTRSYVSHSHVFPGLDRHFLFTAFVAIDKGGGPPSVRHGLPHLDERRTWGSCSIITTTPGHHHEHTTISGLRLGRASILRGPY